MPAKNKIAGVLVSMVNYRTFNVKSTFVELFSFEQKHLFFTPHKITGIFNIMWTSSLVGILENCQWCNKPLA